MDEGFVNWQHMQAQLVAAVNADKLQEWCNRMGFTYEAARWLGVGWLGVKKAWTFPERDNKGEIVGIECRHMDSGRKWMLTGSKRGLSFAPDPDWGGVPAYLDHPVFVVEGATDTLACISREIWTVGKPNATGTTDSNFWLQELLKDQDVALVSENDKGIGAVAFLDDAKRLFPIVKSIRSVTPAPNVKDIREWFKADADAILSIDEQLRNRRPMEASEAVYLAGDVLLDTAPLRVAEAFVAEKFNLRGLTTLRYWCGLWFHYRGMAYLEVEEQWVKSTLWYWCDSKKCVEYEGKGVEREAKEKPFTPTAQRVAGIMEALKSLSRVLTSREYQMPCWLDSAVHLQPKDMICFENGILDVEKYTKSGQCTFHASNPSWFSRSYCPYSFSPTDIRLAKPFLDFLYEIFNNDEQSVQVLREWLGYCMVPDTSLEKFMLMIGRPSAGKGTVMDVMTEVVGRANIYFTRINDIGERFGLFGALGKTNVFLTDAHVTNLEKAQNALEVIKTITGRGAINVEGKNLNAKDVLLPIRFTISVNEMPNFQDSAAALRRRLLITWFPNSYEGRADPTLKDRLCHPDVIRGVAAWALEGLRHVRLRRRFTEPELSKAIAKEFERTNTPVSSFVMEECLVKGDAEIEKKALFMKWSEWCKARGMTPGNMSSFGQKLISTLPSVTTGKVRDGNGYRFPVYSGIRCRTPADGPA